MPEFMDLLLPLGTRPVAQMCSPNHNNGFYQRTNLGTTSPSLQLPNRAWSGQDLKLCYSLKSIERSESQLDWPWSIRHCAVHHTFDVENVRSTWVIVKGNQLIEKRVTSATSGRGPPEFSSYESIDRAFAAALATHRMMLDWSAESWPRYINFLEDRFKELTQGAISNDADVPTQAPEPDELFTALSRKNTQMTSLSAKSRSFSFRSIGAPARRTNTSPTISEMQPLQPQQVYMTTKTGKRQPLPPGKSLPSAEASNKPAIQYDTYGQRQFRFRHLQDIQDLEDSANETVLILKLNLNICDQIEDFYRSLFDHGELPEASIRQKCQHDIARFERRVQQTQNEMKAQIVRVEWLLRIINDRKTLVSLPLQLIGVQAAFVREDATY